jgi:hypothetical protein
VPDGTSTIEPDVATGALLRGEADCWAGRVVLVLGALLVEGE